MNKKIHETIQQIRKGIAEVMLWANRRLDALRDRNEMLKLAADNPQLLHDVIREIDDSVDLAKCQLHEISVQVAILKGEARRLQLEQRPAEDVETRLTRIEKTLDGIYGGPDRWSPKGG
jgi:hypothetical protein